MIPLAANHSPNAHLKENGISGSFKCGAGLIKTVLPPATHSYAGNKQYSLRELNTEQAGTEGSRRVELFVTRGSFIDGQGCSAQVWLRCSRRADTNTLTIVAQWEREY